MAREPEPDRPEPGPEGSPGPRPPTGAWATAAVLAVLFYLLVSPLVGGEARPEIAYTEFKRLVARGDVTKVVMRGHAVEGELQAAQSLGTPERSTKRFRTAVPEVGDQGLLGLLEAHGVVVDVQSAEPGGPVMRLLLGLLPWVLFIGVWIWLMRRASRNLIGGIGGGGELGKFLRPGTGEGKTPETRFRDVAGQKSAKQEVAELVEFLRHPERYRRLGAEIPHGILLVGPPGTGKTLLARALAGEAGVPFFAMSASEFIEVFVGVGASRVRSLFKQAREKAPSIVFLDEIDSVGRVRGAGLGGGHDEREQTLNQILAELDGFSGHEAVVVLAATNRPDVLDPALLRPGRFDRHIALELPDRPARLEILQLHTRKVPLDGDVDLDRVAQGTPGFSGADLKNLVNEAAMRAARLGRERVVQEDFEQMRDRVIMGSERALVIGPEERHRLAVHEVGHTVAAYHLPQADPLYKVSIIPRGHSLGGTHQVPAEERHTLPEEYLRDRLAVLLGGRTAERLLLGSVSSGADDDIRQATALARSMVTRWGMSDIGPIDLRESEEHPFLGREIAQPRHHSEASAEAVDEAVGELLRQAEQRCERVLTEHRPAVEALVAELETRETLYLPDVEARLGAPAPAGEVVEHPSLSRPKGTGGPHIG